jgi:hypothetical protein
MDNEELLPQDYKEISDYQVKKTMAQCKGAIWSLLKNRKI